MTQKNHLETTVPVRGSGWEVPEQHSSLCEQLKDTYPPTPEAFRQPPAREQLPGRVPFLSLWPFPFDLYTLGRLMSWASHQAYVPSPQGCLHLSLCPKKPWISAGECPSLCALLPALSGHRCSSCKGSVVRGGGTEYLLSHRVADGGQGQPNRRDAAWMELEVRRCSAPYSPD